MNNTDTASSLRALADYIDKHDVPRLLSAGRDVLGTCDMHGRGDMPRFLRWADTLGGDVALSAIPHGTTFHLHAHGTLPGTEFAADLVVVVDSADYPTLADEIGPGEDEISVTREQLAKIAVGTVEHAEEFTAPTFTAEQLAEVEHWSKTPFPHEATL